MAAVLGRVEVGLKKTGFTTNIPNNPTARLMYYLNCICNVLEVDTGSSIGRLTQYQNYTSLTNDEVNQLLLLCILISPDELLDKVIFLNEEMCGDSNNEFYELSAVHNHLLVSESIIIGGQRKQVKKIMTCKGSWLQTYYLEPIKTFEGRLRSLVEPETSRAPPAQSLTYPSTPVRRTYSVESSDGCCCTII